MTKWEKILLIFSIAIWGCSSKGPNEPSFEDLIARGWQAFEQKDFPTARQNFSDAKAKDPAQVEGYTGLGWSLFKLGELNQAVSEFAEGSSQAEPTADLFAGWAFALNALKNHSLSNVRADQALQADSTWQFSHGLSLSTNSLHLLKAENFFLIGDFSKALEQVKILNPQFSADIMTNEGLAALAQEIERLKKSPDNKLP